MNYQLTRHLSSGDIVQTLNPSLKCPSQMMFFQPNRSFSHRIIDIHLSHTSREMNQTSHFHLIFILFRKHTTRIHDVTLFNHRKHSTNIEQ